MRNSFFANLTVIALLLFDNELSAQFQFSSLRLPDASPRCWVGHRVGITDILVEYGSPQMRDREIWGKLVPYGRVWRAGANENTVISFSDTVRINGSLLPSGRYGLHVLPEKEGEWTVIFSKNYTSWGSFTYSQSEDALRVRTKPTENVQNDWLKFEFTYPTDEAVTLSLVWEKVRISVPIEVEVSKTVVRKFRQEYLRGVHNFDWTGWYNAANYWFVANVNNSEALEFINRSIANGPNFQNYRLKAAILGRMGSKTDSVAAIKMGISIGNIVDLDNYARGFLRTKRFEEAMYVFGENSKRHPGAWPTDGGMARIYSAKGSFKEALRYAKKALSHAIAQPERKQWETAIKFWTDAVTKLEKNQDIN